MSGAGLSEISERDLLSLKRAIERGDLRAPLREASLQANGLGHLVEALRPHLKLGIEGVSAILEVVLAERRNHKAPVLTLVWTGEDPGVSRSRHTRVMLPELFSRAREHVLMAGYAIDHGAELFASLHRSMVEHGVTATFFVDVGQLAARLRQAAKAAGQSWGLVSAPLAAADGNVAWGKAVVEIFFRLMWPFGLPRPAVYFDPRTADPQSAVSLHAKCLVIDHEYTLITSANFTDRGQTRNIEAGVAIEDRAFATSLERQWWNLVDADTVVQAC